MVVALIGYCWAISRSLWCAQWAALLLAKKQARSETEDHSLAAEADGSTVPAENWRPFEVLRPSHHALPILALSKPSWRQMGLVSSYLGLA